MALAPEVQAALDAVAQVEAGLQARKDQLTQEIADIDAEMRTYTAIRRAAKPEPKKKASVSADGRKYVSEEAVGRVLDMWRRQDGPTTPTALAASEDGISGETVKRATMELRDRGYVIVAGAARGGGTNYAIAPDAPDHLSSDGATASV